MSIAGAAIALRPRVPVQGRPVAVLTPAPPKAAPAPVVDRYEAERAPTALVPLAPLAPVAAPSEGTASSALIERVRGVVDRLGESVRAFVEDNALSRAVGALLKKSVAPAIDWAGEGIAKGLEKLGAWADGLGDSLAARAVRKVLGSETLRHTSFLVGGGVRLNIPGVNVNAGVFGTQYVPSVALAEKAGSTSKGLYTNWGADVQSPLGGIGWGRRGKAGAEMNLFFVSASFDSKQEVVFIGIPGILGVVVGKDSERGSYLSFQNAIPLTPLWYFGPLATYGLEVYSPLLDPINKYVTRPLAKGIMKIGQGIAWVADKALKLVARPGRRSLPARPPGREREALCFPGGVRS